jgi:hypothetical protein
MEQLHVLCPQLNVELSYAREVTSRMVKAGGQRLAVFLKAK